MGMYENAMLPHIMYYYVLKFTKLLRFLAQSWMLCTENVKKPANNTQTSNNIEGSIHLDQLIQ